MTDVRSIGSDWRHDVSESHPMRNPTPSRVENPSPSFAKIGCEFHPLPKELLRAGNLSFGALALFAVLWNVTGRGTRPCTLTNDQLAGEIGRNRSDVIRYLSELEKTSMIARHFDASGRIRKCINATWKPSPATELAVAPPATVTEPSVVGDAKVGCPVAEPAVTLKNPQEAKEEFAGGDFAPGRAGEGSASGPVRYPQPPGYAKAMRELERDLADMGWSMSADGSLKVRPGWSEGRPLKDDMLARLAKTNSVERRILLGEV